MIISTGKFAGASLGAVATEDLPLVAHEARRARDRALLGAALSEIGRRQRSSQRRRRRPSAAARPARVRRNHIDLLA
jgi:hypothetical protein